MSSRPWTDRVQDILDALTEIQAFMQGADLTAFRSDAKTIKAIELNFIIIGEAATHIPAEVQQSHPEVPWRLMKAMRNRLVHVYFAVDPQIVWDTVQNELPALVAPLVKLLEIKVDGKDDETL